MVGNGGNVTQAMIAAGLSPNTAHTPKKLTDSKGFKEVLAEYGLTEGLITAALVEDINAKPEKRFNELSLGAEILGMKKREGGPTNNVLILNISKEVAIKHGLDSPDVVNA